MITFVYDILKENASGNTKLEIIKDYDKVLSLNLLQKEKELDEELIKYINKRIEERKLAKQNQDFAKADEIRTELENKNIYLKDTREGTIFEVR